MKRIISVILAAMMLLMIAPTAAHGKRAESRAPYGYVEHEYEQLLAFMEQTNSAGVKNGTQLSSAYDPNDPETWGGIQFIKLIVRECLQRPGNMGRHLLVHSTDGIHTCRIHLLQHL